MEFSGEIKRPNYASSTSISIYSPLFIYLKHVGVFPYKIEVVRAKRFKSVNNSKSTSLERGEQNTLFNQQIQELEDPIQTVKLGYETTGSFFTFANAAFLYLSLKTAFTSWRCLQQMWDLNNSVLQKLQLLAFFLTTLIAFIIAYKFFRCKHAITKAISDACAIQQEIMGTGTDDHPTAVHFCMINCITLQKHVLTTRFRRH